MVEVVLIKFSYELMRVTQGHFESSNFKIYNKRPIKSLTEYLHYIEYFNKLWDEESHWYRGVSKSKYKLIPSIYRPTTWNYNETNAYNITSKFINKAKGILDPDDYPESKWGWYQLMQHYGVPSRLLDWTEGHLIALYFSVRNLNEISTPCVWIIDPWYLNELSVNQITVFYTDPIVREEADKIIDQYLNKDLDDETKLPDYPAAFEPAYLDERLRAQKSCFTVHGKYRDGFIRLYQNQDDFVIIQLRISNSCARRIKSELFLAGISDSTLFPDMEGLARDLKNQYEMN